MVEPVPFASRFLERMSHLLGGEFPAFMQALEQEPVRALRVNTLKLNADEFASICPFPLGSIVPWCPSAFTLPPSHPVVERPDGSGGIERTPPEPGKHPFHLAGLYYLQDPSAMVAAELLAPQPGEQVLDLTAAPGGKTTHLAARMQGQGLLVANEIKTSRVNHLVVNVERWGAGNVVITNETPERLADHFGAYFHRVLVDAPCSGEGMFRKDAGTRRDWSERMVAGCAVRQKNILRVAAHLVRPGGHLLYSTCTFNLEENEAVISQFLGEHPDFEVEAVPQQAGFMPGRPDWLAEDVPESHPDDRLRLAVRLFPHRLTGEGHFACLLQRKTGQMEAAPPSWRVNKIPPEEWQVWRSFSQETLGIDLDRSRLHMQSDRLFFLPEQTPHLSGLRVTMPGLWLGTFKKRRFEPAHPLALYLRGDQPRSMLVFSAHSREVAAYLRGEPLPLQGMPGWVLITADSWPLGWGKQVQGILKNHYPRGWIQNTSNPDRILL
jgi:NOL1/NOP2/sun family putative RNA methylase